MGAPVLFPNSPTLNQLHPTPAVAGLPVYRWDGEKWTIQAAPQPPYSQFYISDTPPAGAADGAFWWDSSAGLLYVRYNDGTSTQWVSASPLPDLSAFVRGDVAQSLSTAQQQQARSNIYAAPFGVMSYSGLQINGGMEITQELGSGVAVSVSNTTKFVCDGWQLGSNGTQVVTGTSTTNTTLPGFTSQLNVGVTTTNTSPAAGNYVNLWQSIEGIRASRLMWGTANAQPITISFWIYSTRTGMYSGSIRNSPITRSYIFTYQVNAASTWEYKTVTIPGDTAGTWTRDNTVGMQVSFTQMCGSTLQTAAGVWTAGNFIAAPGTTNGVQTTSDVHIFTGVTVHPGTQAPIAAQSAFIMRPYQDELLICKRYYQRYIYPDNILRYDGYASSGASITINLIFEVEMRAAPVQGAPGTWAFSGCSGLSFGTARKCTFSLSSTATQTGAVAFANSGAVGTGCYFDARI